MIFPRALPLPPERVRRAFGVTRIARVSGLDRAPVEVACAVRPEGHVLQVSNGKGWSFEDAARSALSEAAELSAAERVNRSALRFGSFRELQGSGAVWPEAEIAEEARELFIAWTEATRLGSKEKAWVPAQYVHCPPAGTFLGPALFRWTSNGLAAHPDRAQAVTHALREVIERDQLARALPHGWSAAAVRKHKVSVPRGLRERVAAFEERGFIVALFDLTPSRGFGVPVGGALLFDREGGAVPMTAGYACRPTLVGALEGALLEAAQSRLTDIHGAREDVQPGAEGAVVELRAACERAKPHPVISAPAVNELNALRRARVEDVLVVDLCSEPLHVVRVIVPGLTVSELL